MDCPRLKIMTDTLVGPLEDKLAGVGCGDDGAGEEVTDRLHGDAKLWRLVHEGTAARRRLLSFRFPAAGSAIDARSRSARSLARKASAAMTRVM
jgi:hypothetical protein